MPIESAGPQNYGGQVQAPTTTTGPSPSAATSGSTNVFSKDSIVNTEGTQTYTPAYVEPTNRPQLPPPPDQNSGNYQNTGCVPPDLKPTDPETLFQNKLEQLVAQVAIKDPNLAEKVKFVLTHPDAKLEGGDFQKAGGIAIKLQSQATEFVKVTTGDTKFEAPKPDTAGANQELSEKKNGIFEKIVNDNNSLTTKEKNSLLIAFLHPELKTKESLSPKLQKLLEKYEGASEKVFDKLGIAPKNFEVPKDSTGFDLKEGFAFADAFENSMESFMFTQTPPLNEHDANFLRFKLNNPNGPKPPVPEGRTEEQMNILFKAVFSEAKTAYTKESGFPPEFTPEPPKEIFEAGLLGHFESNFEALLSKQSPPLTEAQKTALKAALGELPENIPKEIKALFEMLKGAAAAEVVKAFDLPPSWSPKTRDLTKPSVVKQRAEVAETLKAVQAGQAMIAQLQAAVDQMPEGADKQSYGNYLKVVGAALGKFSETLFAQSANDSNISRQMTLGNADAQLGKIKVQKDKADESKAKAKKAEKMQKVMGIFMAIFMGPLGIAMAIQKAVTGSNFMEQLTTMIMTAIESAVKSPLLQAILKAMAGVFITLFALVVGGPLSVLYALQTAVEQLGNTISAFLLAAGVPENKAKMAGMIIAQGIAIIAEIVVTIVSLGGASALLIGSFANMAKVVMDVVKQAMTIMTDIIKAAQNFVKVMTQALRSFSQIAKNLGRDLRRALEVVEDLTQAAQKAAKLADKTPNAINIAKAEKAFAELNEGIQKMQNVAQKLAEQMAKEARVFKGPGEEGVKQAANAAQAFADKLAKQSDEIAKMAEQVTKTANSGSKSAQNLEKNIHRAITGISIGSAAVSGVSGGLSAGREVLLGQIERIKADMQADMITIRAIVKAVKAIIDEIVTGMAQTGSMIKSVQKQQQEKYNHSGFNFVC